MIFRVPIKLNDNDDYMIIAVDEFENDNCPIYTVADLTSFFNNSGKLYDDIQKDIEEAKQVALNKPTPKPTGKKSEKEPKAPKEPKSKAGKSALNIENGKFLNFDA